MGCGEYALGIQRVNHITGKKNTASRFHAHIRTAVSQLGQKERRKDGWKNEGKEEGNSH